MKKSWCGRIGLLLACLLAALAETPALSTQLGTPVWTNGQVQFTLNGVSGVSYVIEHSPDLQTWTPLLTNSGFSATRVITADAPDAAGFYRAFKVPIPLFTAALGATGNIDLNGTSISIDSFDSGDTNYSNGGLYPFGDVSKTKANGDVCTDSTLADSLSIGNAEIKGHVKTGPGANTIRIGSNGSVGSRLWVEGGALGIEPGWSSTDFNVVFPDVTLPQTVWIPASPASPGNDVINGVTYGYVFNTSGDYYINNLNGGVYVNSNAVVRLKIYNSVNTSQYVFTINPNNAYLQIFMVGSAFTLSASAFIDNQSGYAERFNLFGLPSCNNIIFGTRNFYGCIYAPEADFMLGGGGNNTWDFVGSSVTKWVTVNGHYNFHYDENLQRVGPVR
jgi:hypothetical protein